MGDRLSRAERVALAQRLARAMAERGADLDAIGRAAGLGPETIRMIADGRLLPTVEIRRALAAALGIDPREVT